MKKENKENVVYQHKNSLLSLVEREIVSYKGKTDVDKRFQCLLGFRVVNVLISKQKD